jgi:LPS-assembly lipoprotein
MDRRRTLSLLLSAAAAAAVAGCGFQLRQAPNFAFNSIHITNSSSLVNELRRSMGASGAVQVLDSATQAQVVLELLSEQREKVVVGMTATGQVREFQLRTRLRFRLRTPGGKELIPDTELVQQRDISFNESAVLSKETEENLLYRDMQNDLVQQLMRRLAAVKSL